MRIEIYNVGAAGIIKDVPAHLLPPEAWSDGRNVRFRDNVALKSSGHVNVFGTPSAAPYWAMPVTDPTNVFWVYSSLTKLYGTDGAAHAELTRAVGGDYSTSQDRLWNGGILGGIPVITNQADVPQAWLSAGLGNDFENLPNWPSTTRCRSIRPFKAFLIALNITEGGANYPHRVMWSHPADPGAVPSSWDYTDPTKDAGIQDLNDAQFGTIVTGLGMRDSFVIYKERSTWGMQHIGGAFVFRFYPIFESIGCLGIHCVTSFGEGAKHFVATGEDVIVHNGQEKLSVLDKRWRRWLNANIDETYAKRSFVVENPLEREVWFCFPEVGATAATLALVWSAVDGSVTVRELPGGISHIALGPVPNLSAGGGVWDGDSGTWDSDLTVWDDQTFRGYQARLLQSNKNTTNLQQMDTSEQFASSDMTVFLERASLPYFGKDRQGNPKADFEVRKLWKRIWPKISGGPVDIRVGVQERLGDSIVWRPAQSFNPMTQKYLDFVASGRLISVRFESNGSSNWQLDGYDIELEPLGLL